MTHTEEIVPLAEKGGGSPNPKRRLTIARYHRELAEDYRKQKHPLHYEEIAQKHIAEAERLERKEKMR